MVGIFFPDYYQLDRIKSVAPFIPFSKEVNVMVKINKILFPCDLTENSTKILQYVLSISDKYNSIIYLLHVVQDLKKWGSLYVPHPSTDLLQKEALQGAEKALQRVCDEQLQGCPNFQRKIVAGVLAIVLGCFGVHKFVLGYTTEGLIMLLVTLLTCGFGSIVMSIIGIIEGVIYLTTPDDRFYDVYIRNRKGWF